MTTPADIKRGLVFQGMLLLPLLPLLVMLIQLMQLQTVVLCCLACNMMIPRRTLYRETITKHS